MDDFFTTTRTSILNIYEKCYESVSIKEGDNNSSEILQSDKARPKKWKLKQSGRYQQLTDQMDCDDNKGIMDFFNKHGNFERLHVDGDVKFNECNDKVFD